MGDAVEGIVSDLADIEALASAHGLDVKNNSNGHIQISGRGVLVNYYPFSKKRTVWCKDGRRATDCTAWDAVRMCLTGDNKQLRPTKKPPKTRPEIDLQPAVTNPAGVQHFYSGEVPPWDESLEWLSANTYSDSVRLSAYRLEMDALELRVEANELDEVAS